MPITGPNSYPATMQQFFQHWNSLNALLGTPVVLTGARTVANFSDWCEEVDVLLNQTQAAVISAVNVKGELDMLKEDLISWMVIFNQTMRSMFPEASYTRNLQQAPAQTAGRGNFTEPLVKSEQLWLDAMAGLGAVIEIKRRRTLPNGSISTELLTAEAFGELIVAMQGKWNEWSRAQQAAENKRELRNDMMKLAYDAMRDYRARVPLELPPGHALLDSLPALSPVASQTPDAPEATGAWNAGTLQADLAATPSTSAEVDHTELRYSPDEVYNEDNEVTLASVPAGGTLTFSTDIGLAVPGDTSRFTWVAVTGNGHEGRSNVVAVTRP